MDGLYEILVNIVSSIEVVYCKRFFYINLHFWCFVIYRKILNI